MKNIKKYLISFLFLFILFISLKLITYSLPSYKIRGHIIESLETFNYEREYRPPVANSKTFNFYLDNFTDSLILNISLNKGINKNANVIQKLAEDSYYREPNTGIIESLQISTLNPNIKNNVEYARYWHGIQVIIRPLLLFFNYSEIRIILMISIIILLCISFSLMSKNIGMSYSCAFAITLGFMYIIFIPMSIQYSAMMLILLLSVIIVNLLYLNKRGKYLFLSMFCIGCCACFFDLLTYPLITFGIPLSLALISEIKHNDLDLVNQFKYIFKSGFCWLCGYSITFFSKWALASIIMKDNVIISSLKQFLGRSDITGVQHIGKIETIIKNFNLYFNIIAISLMVISIVLWLLLYRYRKKTKNIVSFLFIAIIPYIWYLVLCQHSYIHAFFTNKIQAITMFSILCALLVTTDLLKYKNKENISHTFVVLAYKESKYLEECIKSVVNQSVKTKIVIATSTPNNFINEIAKKYKLEIIEHKNSKGIADDFNFAANCINSDLITIAHQDDVYDKDYSKEVISNFKKYNDTIIMFTNYYEIRNNEKIYTNKNIKIKRILLLPLRIKNLSNRKFVKRSSLRFGNAICCPSVTFCKNNIKTNEIFTSNFTSNMDWLAWERLSKMKGRFIYINKPLMGHRVHDESTTTKIIKDGKRTNEDYEMFLKFWPKKIAKVINKLYKNSEKSNNVE